MLFRSHDSKQHAPDTGHRRGQHGSAGTRSFPEASHAPADRLASASENDDPAPLRVGSLFDSLHATDVRRTDAIMLQSHQFRCRVPAARDPLLLLRYFSVSVSHCHHVIWTSPDVEEVILELQEAKRASHHHDDVIDRRATTEHLSFVHCLSAIVAS